MRPDSLPDLVTTDLMMPVLGGVELIQRLRSEPRTAWIPIVVISGSPEAARALQRSGLVEAIVNKPFDATVLAQCVRDVTDRAARPQVDDAPAIAS
jgi:CheY-like chemotaxis protein